MNNKYEQKIQKKYYILYKQIKEIVPTVPDQRLFESSAAQLNLSAWDSHLIWKSLYRELQTLDSAPYRDNTYDDTIYKILQNSFGVPVNKSDKIKIVENQLLKNYISYPSKNFKNELINFIATYPILSYLLIDINKNYPFAIMGRHPIIIKEIALSDKWKTISRSQKMQVKLRLPELRRSTYAAQWIKYSSDKHDIDLLLTNVNIDDDYVYIADAAATYNNPNLMIILWKYLNSEEKVHDSIINFIIILDLVDLFREAININTQIINDDVWAITIESTSENILQHLVDNFSPINQKVITSALASLEINEESKSLFNLIKILSKKYRIERFYRYNDFLQTLLDSHDFEAIKLVVDLGMDIKTGITYEVEEENIAISPLLYTLNENKSKDIKEYMLKLYDVPKDILLYSAVENTLVYATVYLLEKYKYGTEVLKEALLYTKTAEIRNFIYDALKQNPRIIPTIFELKK